MIETLKALVEALRQELQEYGEMLARLDQQQKSILRRATDDIVASIACIQEQAGLIVQVRQSREEVQRRLLKDCRLSEQATLAELFERIPPQYRPLLEALVQENNQLLFRVRKRADQNHILLRRAFELMHDLLKTLSPAGQSALYDCGGKSLQHQPPACTLYEAAG